jgi:hypothetical protein
VAACRTQALHEFTGTEKVDTGHRTLDARTPDTRTLAQDADMATKAR